MVRRQLRKQQGDTLKLCNLLKINNARVAELADALDLGSSGEIRRGSTPLSRTTLESKGYESSHARAHLFTALLFMVVPILWPDDTRSSLSAVSW